MLLIARFAALPIGILVCFFLMGLFNRLRRANTIESEKSSGRAGTLKNAFFGRTRVQDDTMPDARVQAGLVYNKKMKRLEVSGRIGQDSLDHIFQ
jgi:hypothetical protein